MVMCALLDAKHGDVGHVACMLMHRLLPSLLGVAHPAASGGHARKGAAQEASLRRHTALQFVLAALRCAWAGRPLRACSQCTACIACARAGIRPFVLSLRHRMGSDDPLVHLLPVLHTLMRFSPKGAWLTDPVRSPS